MSHWIGTLAPADAGMDEFKECLRRLRAGETAEALLYVRRALCREPQNPFYLSYSGLLAAINEKSYADAESLCQKALDLKGNHAQLYLNLAEVYQQAGRTANAIETLERGINAAGRDYRLRRALERIGVRRLPVLAFLHRTHPLNRLLGRWRHRLCGPSRLQ